MARRVSHPNVCRVYDVGEVDGLTFLSMEYVDGEDLASLLRRIGRLVGDKALEIARQLCAGLAAAHREGVLHRDLKPANIMLDGRGRVVITDFGLASLAERVEGIEARNGTPAYMAPEQLAGQEVTARSDIYSLGLVLYEIFTGKRAFAAETLAELDQAAQPAARRARPSTLGEGPRPRGRARDPAVSRGRPVQSGPRELWPWRRPCPVAILWPQRWRRAKRRRRKWWPPPVKPPASRRAWPITSLAAVILGLAAVVFIGAEGQWPATDEWHFAPGGS